MKTEKPEFAGMTGNPQASDSIAWRPTKTDYAEFQVVKHSLMRVLEKVITEKYLENFTTEYAVNESKAEKWLFELFPQLKPKEETLAE